MSVERESQWERASSRGSAHGPGDASLDGVSDYRSVVGNTKQTQPSTPPLPFNPENASHPAFPVGLASERCSLLRGVVDSCSEGVALLDVDGKVLLWNEAMAKLTGCSAEEALGQQCDQPLLITPVDSPDDSSGAIQTEEPGWWLQPGRRQVVVRGKGGRELRTILNITPQLNAQGEIGGVVLTLACVNDLLEIERLKDEFISLASHELRTPLTSVKGYASLLLRRGRYEPRLLETILQQSNLMQRLINDLLEATRLQNGQIRLCPAPLDLAQLAAQVVDRFALIHPDHRFSLDSADDLPLARADRDRIEQVFTHLLDNAVSYSPSGSLIKLGITCLEPQTYPDGQDPSPRSLLVSVADKGIGISPEDLPHVFERFFRASNADVQQVLGAGLGLFRVKEIVERHKGRVWAESKPGLGSTFYFTLPCVGEESAQQGLDLWR